jgi:hypothetical protein
MKDQDMMAKQVDETGRAVAVMRLERMAEEELGTTSERFYLSTTVPATQTSTPLSTSTYE